MSYISRELKPKFEEVFSPLLEFLSKKRVSPNLLTLSGLILVLLGSYLLLFRGGLLTSLLLLIGSSLDAIDGALARKEKVQGKFGSFLDSTVDRISDALPFIALTLRYSYQSNQVGVILSLFALLFSFMVSYARAKGESLGLNMRVGLFERTERWIVLLLGIAFGLEQVSLLIILVGSLVTFFQRLLKVLRETQN